MIGLYGVRRPNKTEGKFPPKSKDGCFGSVYLPFLDSDWVREYFNAPCQPHFNVNLYDLDVNNAQFLHILPYLMRHYLF